MAGKIFLLFVGSANPSSHLNVLFNVAEASGNDDLQFK